VVTAQANALGARRELQLRLRAPAGGGGADPGPGRRLAGAVGRPRPPAGGDTCAGRGLARRCYPDRAGVG
jgi:hypothetical protein